MHDIRLPSHAMNWKRTFRLLRPDFRSKEGVSTFLYRLTLLFFIVIFVALVVVTPIDTIFQSNTSGQFWDAIIIVVAYVLAVVFIIALCFLRIFYVRRALSSIPREYMIRENDVPDRMAKQIQRELARCKQVLIDTTPEKRGEHIDHPGLRNPSVLEGVLDVPYSEVVKTSSAILQLKARALHPSFGQPYGMAIREYVLLLQSYRLIDPEFDVEKFISVYEKARYSGKLLNEKEFNHYMEACFELLYSIKPPGQGRLEQSGFQQPSPGRVRPPILHNASISSYASGVSPFEASRTHSRRHTSSRPSFSDNVNDGEPLQAIDTNHALSALASLIPVETLQRLYSNPASRVHSREASGSYSVRPRLNRDNSYFASQLSPRQSHESSSVMYTSSSSSSSVNSMRSRQSYPSNASVIVRTFSN